MTHEELNKLIWNTDLGPSEKLVLLAFSTDAVEYRSNVSRTNLCKLTGFTLRSIHSIIKNLQKQGILKLEKGGYRGVSSIFTINLQAATS